MDLNLAFDDEDLDFTRDRKQNDHLTPYNVKLCTPEWFARTETQDLRYSSQDSDQPHQNFKFKADLHYHRKQFAEATADYEAALSVLPLNNASVRQDIRESLCRCYMNCGFTEKSLNLARELAFEMSTEDEARQRQTLILLSSVCEKAGRWAECVDALEKYCRLQPFFAQSWGKLGDAYVKSIQESIGDASQNCEQKLTWVKALTCYIRARFLCELSIGTASELVKERDTIFLNEIDKKIDYVPLAKDEKDFACKFIPKDSESIQSEDFKDGSSPDEEDKKQLSSSEIFYNRFCSWFEAYQSSCNS